jgi:pimeloyl-ACP methyl ester carboxylesterase
MLKRVWKWLRFLPLLLLVGALAYLLPYAKATSDATAFLESNESVTVTSKRLKMTDYWLFEPFDASSSTINVLLYQGGKVDHEAYARLASGLALAGYRVYLPALPFRLAFFDASVALRFEAEFGGSWIVVGHSLGGVAMATILEQSDAIIGAVYLGSYPATDVSQSDAFQLILWADQDGLTKYEDVENALDNTNFLTTEVVIIPGGNHAQFGDYGVQKGDGVASIDAATQIALSVSAIYARFSSEVQP